MKRHHNLFTVTGIPSLFLIFAVLCLAVLSLLTLGSSRSELTTAQHSMEKTEAYYTACSKATTTFTEIQKELSQTYKQSTDENTYFSFVQKFVKKSTALSWNSQEHTLCFNEPMSNTQQLTVEVKILYPQSSDDSFLQILQWKTDSTASWTPDNSQSVYKGGIS